MFKFSLFQNLIWKKVIHYKIKTMDSLSVYNLRLLIFFWQPSKNLCIGTVVESIGDIQNVPKKMHLCSKWKISTAFNVQILNAQHKILSISSLKLHKFQNSQALEKNHLQNCHFLTKKYWGLRDGLLFASGVKRVDYVRRYMPQK